MDLADEGGVTLSSVSDWTPGESRTFHLDELPEGCEVNVVSSDRELMTADYADNAIALTAVESGHAIVTVELSMNGSSLSKSYEIQITARHMQAGMTLIDSRAIQPENALESAFHPERENFGSATFASGYLELRAGNQATILFTGFDVTDGEPKPLETPVTVRSSENEVTFDGTYYLSEDRVILQCPRAGQYTLDLVLSCEGYADLPVQYPGPAYPSPPRALPSPPRDLTPMLPRWKWAAASFSMRRPFRRTRFSPSPRTTALSLPQ